ncbi:L-asparaginase [Labilithrix luteola]|uniref:L-asparaginase n=1 Tax=Labilithrix luteola TaxID=1391654 RepID=A0A0K1Q5S4_9BACT|nr:type II asparaginase [Labilithrix luteola]AKV01012.1 L-asparaginase [Labilithrix luteola]
MRPIGVLGFGTALAAVMFACSHNEPPKVPESETTVTTTPPSATDAGPPATDAGASATGTTTTTSSVVSSSESKSNVGESKGPKRNVKILATGGTIAGAGSAGGYGYTSGEFKVDDLIKAVPNIDKLANLSGEQVANIGSQDMNDQVWLKLAKRANELLSRADVDGIVITHGTDTMEETAYFLTLVLRGDKPVALVGSMRPATAISADGPANLYNAVAAVSSPGAKGRGVMVVLNDKIHDARNVTKTNTTNVETFESTNRGPVGLVNSGSVDWFEKMNKKNRGLSEFSITGHNTLPNVEIIYAHSNMDASLIDSAIQNGAKGIVIAGVGDGNMSKAALDALQKAVKSGIVVVRSTRLQSGLVLRNNEVNDDKMGFVASGELNPSKSRVLLQLALLKTKEPKEVQRIFNEY